MILQTLHKFQKNFKELISKVFFTLIVIGAASLQVSKKLMASPPSPRSVERIIDLEAPALLRCLKNYEEM